MKIIELTKNMFTKVDDDDFEFLSKRKWCYSGRYAYGRFGNRMIFMHRVILKVPYGLFTDHIDGDGLNNQKYNLRICTISQNTSNSKLRIDNPSGFRGVRFKKYPCTTGNGRWESRIRFMNKDVHIGYYDTPEEAAHARDDKARELFGEFASLNFPEGV